MKAKIYQPTKTAMQSGLGNTKKWLLEFGKESKLVTDSLMGWAGSSDMKQEVRLKFDSKDEAVSYAKKNKIPYELHEPQQRTLKPKSYSDNFK